MFDDLTMSRTLGSLLDKACVVNMSIKVLLIEICRCYLDLSGSGYLVQFTYNSQ